MTLTGLSASLALVLGVALATTAQASPLKPSLPVAQSVTPAFREQLSASYRAAAAATWTAAQAHAAHLAHTAHLQYLAELAAQKAQAIAAAQAAARAAATAPRPVTSPPPPQAAVAVSFGGGVLTASQVGQLWLGAGGPSWAEPKAVEIAYCESGYNPRAYNPSGATGVWQILGAVLPGDLTNPVVNAANAVAKFKAAGDSFTPWVCQ